MFTALVRLVLNAATNQGYGFHRDELATIDDARHLAWGYVAYPPLRMNDNNVLLDRFAQILTKRIKSRPRSS